MNARNVELALGTVQFGMAYGIAGRGEPVPPSEVRDILARAWDSGVRLLDTAPAYGDIEQHLDHLAGELQFEVVSKIPALPPTGQAAELAEFVRQSVRLSHARLGIRLRTLLFHHGDDLLEPRGEIAWRAAQEAATELGIRLGASFYSPQAATAVHARLPLAVVQLPGNALDQRLALQSSITGLAGVEVHLRSVFLQGLLLLSLECAVTRVPKAKAALGAWTKWCADHGVAPLRAALAVAKTLPGVRYCVVGIDRLAQLEEIAAAWAIAAPMDLAALASTDEEVIDPRRWIAA